VQPRVSVHILTSRLSRDTPLAGYTKSLLRDVEKSSDTDNADSQPHATGYELRLAEFDLQELYSAFAEIQRKASQHSRELAERAKQLAEERARESAERAKQMAEERAQQQNNVSIGSVATDEGDTDTNIRDMDGSTLVQEEIRLVPVEAVDDGSSLSTQDSDSPPSPSKDYSA